MGVVAEGQSLPASLFDGFLGMEDVRRGYHEEEDFYKLLRCDETSTAEQISTEFKVLAREHHPDKVANPDGKEAAEERFVLLKRARDVLLDRETRRQYDQWRTSFRHWISFQDWQKMQGRVHTSIHWGGGGRRLASLEAHGEGGGGGGGKRVGERSEGGVGRGGERGERLCGNLQQFRRSGGGGSHISKFRTYQL